MTFEGTVEGFNSAKGEAWVRLGRDHALRVPASLLFPPVLTENFVRAENAEVMISREAILHPR
jgi:hypothetical protein